MTIGGAFLALAALAWWRERIFAADLLAGFGAAFFLAGLLVPTYLGPVERSWMKLAHAISFVTTPVMMGVMSLRDHYPGGLDATMVCARTRSSTVPRKQDSGRPVLPASAAPRAWNGSFEAAASGDATRQCW